MRTLPTNYRAKASGDTNSPIELYDVYLDTVTIHLAEYDTDVNFYDIDGNTQTYLAYPLKREPAQKASDMSIGSVTVRIANVNRSMSSYIASNDFRGRRVVIRKIFTDLLTSSGDAVILFDGVMDSPVVSEDTLEFNAVDRLTLGREVPRQRFMLLCNHKFGNTECFYGKISGDMYGTYNGSVAAGSTTSRIIDTSLTSGDNFFKDGDAIFTSGANASIRRKITGNDQSSTYFDVDYPLTTAPSVGDTFTLRRSCDKTWYKCSGSFGNDANFSGYPTIPQELVIR